MATRLGTVEPKDFPDEQFDYYSIPAYDLGYSQLTFGKDIGSAKQLLQSDDVLLSRIVPHIRRAWVVGGNKGKRIIGSGEWIVFRDSRFYPGFLRHLLTSDWFHPEFMRTVSGVGGSLLRARPVNVARIVVPIPSLREQRRIAAILDQAEALRAKRYKALAKLETLLHSTFSQLTRDETDVRHLPLEDALEKIIDYRGKSPVKTSEGVPLITARIVKKGVVLPATEFIAESDYVEWMRRGIPQEGDVLFTTEAPLGEVARLGPERVALAQRLLVLRGRKSLLDNEYLMFVLSSASVKEQINRRATGSTVKGIRQSEFRKVVIPILPLRAQREFAALAFRLRKNIERSHRQLLSFDSLLIALQSHAFRGEL